MTLPIPFGWFALTPGRDLPPGGVQPLYYFGEHLVLFRTEDGEPHLLEAFCPHLGAHLGHGGRIEGDAIACPFHGWQFDGSGTCVNVPYASRIPKRAARGPCMHSYPVQERNLMIWAWYHPRRVAPLWDIEDVPELSDPGWTDVDCYDWEIESPIQETGENAVDIAHFVTVHTAQAMPRATINLDGHRRETRLVCPIPSIDGEGNIDFTKLEDIHLVTWACGPGFSFQRFSTRLETVLFSAITPITATRMKLWFAFTRPRDLSPKFGMLADALNAEVVRQVGQDIPIWEHKAFRARPMLCDGDGPIAKYRAWFGQFYDDAAVSPTQAGPVPASRPREEPAFASRG